MEGDRGHAERWRAVKSDIVSVDAELKKLRRSERAAAKCKARQWALSELMRNTALAIYGLTDNALEPAAMYLRQCALECHWPTKTDEELEEIVLDEFLAVDPEKLDGLLRVEDPMDLESMKLAQRCVLEWRAVEWSRERVRGPRVPPPSSLVLQQYEEARMALPEHLRPASRGVASDGKARSWMRRLRRRWGGRHGRLRVRDEPSADELQAKVRVILVMHHVRILSAVSIQYVLT